tara:strand:+ start:5727 stop:6002 length:276 start_codon:yes stop_codon:yes gene_type:complete
MDVVRMICAFFLIAIVLILLGSFFSTQSDADFPFSAKMVVTLIVLVTLVTILTIADLYIITYNLRSDMNAYVSDCNEKVQKKYLENTSNST